MLLLALGSHERKAGTGVRCVLGSLSGGEGSAGEEARRLRAELAGHEQVSVAAGYSAEVERMGGGLCAGGPGGARRAGARVAHGDVPAILLGACAVYTGAAFQWAE